MRSGWGRQGSHNHPQHQPSVVSCTDGHNRHAYQMPGNVRTPHSEASGDDHTPYREGPQLQIKSEVSASFDKKFCQICGYKGQDVSQLRKHLRIHTGEKPYQCPKCTYCSAQSSNLRVHIKRHHPELCQQETQRDLQQVFTDVGVVELPELQGNFNSS